MTFHLIHLAVRCATGPAAVEEIHGADDRRAGPAVESLVMLESLFRFLFKYPPLFFQQGDFVFGISRPMLLAVAVAGAGRRLRAAHLSRRRRRADGARPRRARRRCAWRSLARASSSACSGRR